jgi:hypothetical protein
MLVFLSIQIQMTWNFSYVLNHLWSIRSQSCKSKKAFWDMTKKPDLTQNFQKLITFTKHIFFFWNFENRSVLEYSTISPSFTPRSFHNRSRSRFKDLTSTTFDMWISCHLFSFLFFLFTSFLFPFLFCTWQTPMILLDSQALVLETF